MATQLARSLPADELVAKCICPVKKEFLEGQLLRKHVEAIGSVTAEEPAEKKSNRQQKKVLQHHFLHPPACPCKNCHGSCSREETRWSPRTGSMHFRSGRRPSLPRSALSSYAAPARTDQTASSNMISRPSFGRGRLTSQESAPSQACQNARTVSCAAGPPNTKRRTS
jgi:hypothetical protein